MKFIQSVIDDYDETLTRVYYPTPEMFNKHHHTVETQVFRHNNKVQTIRHIIIKVREE